MRINPALANQMYLNYMDSSDSNSSSSSSSSSSTSSSILPTGTYTKLAAAKYIKDNDKDNDGKLTSDEVTLSAEAFAALDKDSDGSITKAEMQKSLSGKDNEIFSYYKNGGAKSGNEDIVDSLLDGKTASNATINTYVKMAAKSYISANDKDSDGVLSRSEVSLASNAFKLIDTNSNGSLTLSELQNALRDEGESIYKYYKNGGTTKLSTLTSNLLATI